MTDVDPTEQSALGDWALRDRSAALRLFVPPARTPAVSARLALGFALRESLWIGSDATVNNLKSAWWIEELALSEGGGARHPLTQLLAAANARIDWGALARALSELRTSVPEAAGSRVVALVQEMEKALWFDPLPVDPAACLVRARAGLVDVIERRAQAIGLDANRAAATADHGQALRAGPTFDPWTEARRAQALCWIDSMGDAATPAGRMRRWREVWKVWQAVRAVSRRVPSHAAAGDSSGI